MKDIGIGVIGAGMGATLALVNEVPASRLQVRAICAGSEHSARSTAGRLGIARWTTDYRTLLDDRSIDVIGVFSPDHLHAEHAIAALRAGKHVLCTKPMTASLADALEVVRAVEETGRCFMVGQTMRWDPQFATARRVLQDGEIGELCWAEAHYVHDLRHVFEATPWRLTAPQDPLYGGLSHPIDLLRWLLGDVRRVHALGRHGVVEPHSPMLDNFLVNLEFESGVMARALGSFGVVHPPMAMMGLGLYGSRASLVAEYSDLKGGRVQVVQDRFPTLPTAVMDFPPETSGAYGHGETVLRILREFEEVIEGRRAADPDARDAARTIAVCAAVNDSIATGTTVDVPRIV